MIPHFTPRQREVAALVGRGLSYAQIAATLGISPRTAQEHVYAIADQLDDDGQRPYRRVHAWAQRRAA